MNENYFGNTLLSVSKLCFGTLTLSQGQADMTPEEGGELLAYAFNKGVSFFDTAELYGTYKHIRSALKKLSALPVISTKSYAYDRETAKKSLEKARREMDLDTIDIFMLHEQENALTLLGHQKALEYLLEMKEKGIIKAVGISTHAVEPLQCILKAKGINIPGKIFERVSEFEFSAYNEIDVVHPIINAWGMGIIDGNREFMEAHIKSLSLSGTGILAMKILGGGNLLNNYGKAMEYALSLDYVHSFAIGMQSIREIETNLSVLVNKRIESKQIDYAANKNRRLIIEHWCTGCGECVRICRFNAMEIKDNKASADFDKCVLCSYCAAGCKEFAIKVV